MLEMNNTVSEMTNDYGGIIINNILYTWDGEGNYNLSSKILARLLDGEILAFLSRKSHGQRQKKKKKGQAQSLGWQSQTGLSDWACKHTREKVIYNQ